MIPFRTLDKWPRDRTESQRWSPFKADYASTLALLWDELRAIEATDSACILADCSVADIRQDGALRAEARLRSSGVVLCFEGKHGPVKMPCDRFIDWRDNIRAIALSLQALRRVDRYGITSNGEQYRGWTALPPADANGRAEFESIEVALSCLAVIAYGSVPPKPALRAILGDDTALRDVYRDASKKSHPDAGGSDDAMSKVNRARAFIESGKAARNA